MCHLMENSDGFMERCNGHVGGVKRCGDVWQLSAYILRGNLTVIREV